MATLYDVARAAGVSTATVSRVFNGNDHVRASTRARVLEVVDRFGYVPDGAARGLSRRRKEVVGLVALEHPGGDGDLETGSLLYGDQILRGVESVLRAQGWSLLIAFLRSGDDPATQLRAHAAKVDGLLLVGAVVSARELVRVSDVVPVVVIAGDEREDLTDVVAVDNRAGTAALVEHLVAEHGAAHLAYLAGPDDVPDARTRRLAFDAAVAAQRGVEVVEVLDGDFTGASGRDAAARLAARRRLPDAVVCANDQMAWGLVDELAHRGRRVPDELAVVGFDDLHLSALMRPALTTVHQPMRSLGTLGCTRLLERIELDGAPPRLDRLATTLVVRRSCGCPITPAP